MAVEAADILAEAVLMGATSAAASVAANSAVSAAVTLVVPVQPALTEVAFALRQLSQLVVRVLAPLGISAD